MRRLFWAGVGAAGAVVALQRARQVARRFTPEGVAEQAVDAGRRTGAVLHDALGTFRTARAERERELVTALLVEPAGGSVAERRAARDGAPADHADDEDEFF